MWAEVQVWVKTVAVSNTSAVPNIIHRNCMNEITQRKKVNRKSKHGKK